MRGAGALSHAQAQRDRRTTHNTWTVPGGKAEPGETLNAAALRELLEETGLRISETALQHSGTSHADFPESPYTLDIFKIVLMEKPEQVMISPREHSAVCGVTPQGALALPLMKGGELRSRLSDLIHRVEEPLLIGGVVALQ